MTAKRDSGLVLPCYWSTDLNNGIGGVDPVTYNYPLEYDPEPITVLPVTVGVTFKTMSVSKLKKLYRYWLKKSNGYRRDYNGVLFTINYQFFAGIVAAISTFTITPWFFILALINLGSVPYMVYILEYYNKRYNKAVEMTRMIKIILGDK